MFINHSWMEKQIVVIIIEQSSAIERNTFLINTTQGALVIRNLPASAVDIRDTGSIPGSGRSLGEGNGNPLQHSCLENPMDRGAWRATVHGVAKSQMKLKRLSTHAQWQDSPVTLLHKKNHAKKRIYYVVAFTHNSRTSKQEVNTDESSHGEVGVGRHRLACMCLLLVMVMISLAFTSVKSIVYLKHGHRVSAPLREESIHLEIRQPHLRGVKSLAWGHTGLKELKFYVLSVQAKALSFSHYTIATCLNLSRSLFPHL